MKHILPDALAKISKKVGYSISTNRYHVHWRYKIGEIRSDKSEYYRAWNRSIKLYTDEAIEEWAKKFNEYKQSGDSNLWRKLVIDKDK